MEARRCAGTFYTSLTNILLDSILSKPPRLALTPQFLYINSSFSPAPDDTVGNLFRVCDERAA